MKGRRVNNFPKHKYLSLQHNEHWSCYHTVKQFIDNGDFGYDKWVSEEQKQKAIETNECWYLQWYPDTPTTFHTLAAADLDVLLTHVKS